MLIKEGEIKNTLIAGDAGFNGVNFVDSLLKVDGQVRYY